MSRFVFPFLLFRLLLVLCPSVSGALPRHIFQSRRTASTDSLAWIIFVPGHNIISIWSGACVWLKGNPILVCLCVRAHLLVRLRPLLLLFPSSLSSLPRPDSEWRHVKCSRNFLSILRPKAFRVRQFGWPDQVSASSSANKRRIGANKKKPAFPYSINWAAGDNYRPRGQERKKPWRALVIFSRLCQLFKVDEFFCLQLAATPSGTMRKRVVEMKLKCSADHAVKFGARSYNSSCFAEHFWLVGS